MLKIESATIKHIHFFKEMLYEALYVRIGEAPFPKSITEAPSLKKYYDNWDREGDVACVLIADNQPVGACWSRIFTKENPSYGFIDDNTPELTIAIQSEFRNRGLGRDLILRLIEKNKQLGYRQISLSVDQESPTVRLYLRLGFKIFKREDTAFTMLKVF